MSQQPPPIVEPCLSMQFQQLAYVVHLPERRDAVVIDPGLEPDVILEYVESRRLELKAVLNTHGHGDHIGGPGRHILDVGYGSGGHGDQIRRSCVGGALSREG